MKRLYFLFLFLLPVLAFAYTGPKEVQAMISQGNPQAALQALTPILASNPRSAAAWYLDAEALDASGNVAGAKTALLKAENLSPAMSFADPKKLTLLEQRLGVENVAAAKTWKTVKGVLWALAVLAALGLGFVLTFRWKSNREKRAELRGEYNSLLGDLQVLMDKLSSLKLELRLYKLSEKEVDAALALAAQASSELGKVFATNDLDAWKHELEVATEDLYVEAYEILLEQQQALADAKAGKEPRMKPEPAPEQASAHTPAPFVEAVEHHTKPWEEFAPSYTPPPVYVQPQSSSPDVFSQVLAADLVADAIEKPSRSSRVDDWAPPSDSGGSFFSSSSDSFSSSSDSGGSWSSDSFSSGSDSGFDSSSDSWD